MLKKYLNFVLYYIYLNFNLIILLNKNFFELFKILKKKYVIRMYDTYV